MTETTTILFANFKPMPKLETEFRIVILNVVEDEEKQCLKPSPISLNSSFVVLYTHYTHGNGT